MDIEALVTAIGLSFSTVHGVWNTRRALRSARSKAAAAAAAAQRRHAELTPRFLITCEPSDPWSPTLRLGVFLCGPTELERLDALTVTIRDDPWRGQGASLAGRPTPEQIAVQVWAPYRFAPGADPVRGVPGPNRIGRTTPASELPVGQELPLFLEPTHPPSWSQQTYENWRRERGTAVRLALECRRDGWDPWILTCEVDPDGQSKVEIP